MLKEWLPRISGEVRAYLKGASEALLYVQDGLYSQEPEVKDKPCGICM